MRPLVRAAAVSVVFHAAGMAGVLWLARSVGRVQLASTTEETLGVGTLDEADLKDAADTRTMGPAAPERPPRPLRARAVRTVPRTPLEPAAVRATAPPPAAVTPAADGGIAKPDVVAPPKPQQRGVPSIALGLVPAGPDALPEGGKSVLELYLAGVEARVRPHWPPPEMTRAMGEAAASAAGARREVVMRVRIGRDGALEGVSVGTSAGLAVVDRAAAAALERGAPFSGLPSAVQDDEGGLTFYFRFPLELPLKIFAAAVKRIVGAQWQPSVAFRHRGDRDRVTVVRAQLQADGLLAAATLESSSGLGMLDDGALAAFKKGMRFPPPPESLREVAGVVAVRIGFLHSVRGTPEVRVLRTP